MQGGAGVPTPVYAIYRQEWGLSSPTITVIFAAYAFGVLTTLLTLGAASDAIGRRPLIIGGLALQAIAQLTFALAHGPAELLVGRAVQGAGVGAATAATGAAIADINERRAESVNAYGPAIGVGLLTLGSAAIVQYAPLPERLPYLVLMAAFVAQIAAVSLVPMRTSVRTSWSLKPRLHIPPQARRAVVVVLPCLVAVWATVGLLLSLGPSIASDVLRDDAPLVGGVLIFGFEAAAFVAVATAGRWSPRTQLHVGATALAVAATCAFVGLLGPTSLLCVAVILGGVGFGAGLRGAFGLTLPLAAEHQRAGLLSTVWLVSYLAVSLPTIAAGVAADSLPMRTVATVYVGVIVLAAAATTVIDFASESRASRRRVGPRS